MDDVQEVFYYIYNMIRYLFILFLIVKGATAFCQNHKSKGDIYLLESKYDSALFFFNQEVNYYQKQKKEDTVYADLLLKRGKVYQFSQKYDLAFIDYKNAEKIFQNEKNINGIIACYIRFGDYYRNNGDLNTSFDYFNKAFDLIEQHQTTIKNNALYYNRLAALIGQTAGDLSLVLEYSNKAIEYSKQINDLYTEASSYNEIAYVYENNKSPLSEKYFLKSLSLYDSLQSPRNEVTVISNLARHYFKRGQNNNSIFYCNKGIRLIEGTDWNNMKSELYFLKYNNYYSLSNYKEAIHLLDSAYQFKLLDKELVWNKSINEVETKYEVEKKNNIINKQYSLSNNLLKDNQLKETQIKYYFVILILVFIIFGIGLFAYFKIKKSNKELAKSLEQKNILV